MQCVAHCDARDMVIVGEVIVLAAIPLLKAMEKKKSVSRMLLCVSNLLLDRLTAFQNSWWL